MTESRPDPDALLAQVTAEEKKSTRGRLKVFFGASAGVGKTYAMLEEARKRAEEGMQILIGYAEPHIRPDTEALLLGMEILPYKMVEYKNTQFKEFDLDGALSRKPSLVCVDELAHTNIPGTPAPRHAKRFQDVLELIDAGINVYTTLNVQHLESVNDIVERTSGIKVRETLPDWVLEQADEVQLIDISPDKLIERIAEGKIYKQHQADHITKQFFNRGNISALRELALRRTADRVDAQMEDFRREAGVKTLWPTAERILVCVGPSPFSARLVRSARRMAAALKTQWIAASVDTPSSANLPQEARERVTQTLRLAEQLGAQTVKLSGSNPADEIIAYAKTKNVARIIIGKSDQPRWKDILKGSIVDELIRKSGQMDVYVIRDERTEVSMPRSQKPAARKPVDVTAYAWAVGICAATTLLGMLLYHKLGYRPGLPGEDPHRFSNTNVLMIDLLAVLFIALRFGRGPAVLASLLAVAAFDFTVVPPYFSFAVSDTQYFVTFGCMFAAALIISTLTDRVKQQGVVARQSERRTAALLDLSRELAATREKKEILAAAVRHVSEVFDCKVGVLLPDADNHLVVANSNWDLQLDDKEMSVAQWAFEHDQPAGKTTPTLPSAHGLYLPLRTSQGDEGVLGVTGPALDRIGDPDRFHLLEAFASQTAVAIERAGLAEEAQRAWARVEAEFIRNTLLSGVSHDLRTPLAVITGSASTLLEAGHAIDERGRRELLAGIADEAEHMEHFINNLLDMTRLESGSQKPKREQYPLQELVASTLQRLRKKIGERQIVIDIASDFPLLFVDGTLFEQVLINLVDNALQYTPADTAIEISGQSRDKAVEISVLDRGPGLPADDPTRVFQKFYRSAAGAKHRGIGLGLAICRGIVELHGGTITAKNRDGGGAAFIITLSGDSLRPGKPAMIETLA
jgi:two-component system, OmpR family, sensor histidine kinase KdpD